MALNPIVFTENVVKSFLRYQLTTYAFADERLRQQMRESSPNYSMAIPMRRRIPTIRLRRRPTPCGSRAVDSCSPVRDCPRRVLPNLYVCGGTGPGALSVTCLHDGEGHPCAGVHQAAGTAATAFGMVTTGRNRNDVVDPRERVDILPLAAFSAVLRVGP